MKTLILSSTGFTGIGWVAEPVTQQALADALARVGMEVAIAEVASTADLDPLLRALPRDTLVWANGYYVRTGAGEETEWLADILEAEGVPFVGPPAATLRAVLHKDDCQARLAAAGIPIPRFAVVRTRDPEVIRDVFQATGLSWPVVVKPTSAAGSLGIGLAADAESLAARVGHNLDRHGPRVMIEEYLPGNDITVGVFRRGPETYLLPTWYEMLDRRPGRGILDRLDRLRPWGGPKQMRIVEDPHVLEQVGTIIPRAVEELDVRDVTRIDGRLDERGVLRIFDVNGMPALDVPGAVLLRQVMTIRKGTDAAAALDRVVSTLIASAAERYGLETPAAVAARSFSHRTADRQEPRVA